MHRLINSRRVELVLGALLLSSFLAANLGTSSRSPVIWQDEVMFTDPAANLHFDDGVRFGGTGRGCNEARRGRLHCQGPAAN